MVSVPISVVVPAYNAASVIFSTLSRLGRQSFRDFEVIVVDDGSTDKTSLVAEAAASKDPRIRIVRKSNGGVSSARNAGIAAVTGRWVLFLDADDWLDDDFLTRMLAALSARPGSCVARCRHARVTPSGAEIVGPENDPDQDHFFETLARRAMGATHAYLTETALVREVGGFDETLKSCEDWDLWQRIARTGAHLATVPDVLAYYRMQRASLTSDGFRLLQDARVVLRRGMSADPRVPRPDPRWTSGVPKHDIEAALQPIAVWCATSALVAGKPWRPLLDEVLNWSAPGDDYMSLLHSFYEGFLLGHGLAPEEMVDSIDKLEAAAAEIYGEMARRTGCPDLARNWRRGLGSVLALWHLKGCDVRNIVIPTDGLMPPVPGAPDGEHLIVRLPVHGRARRLAEVVHWLPIARADMAHLVVVAAIQRTYDVLRRALIGRVAPQSGPRTGGLRRHLQYRAVSVIQQIGWRLEDLSVQPAPPGGRHASHRENIRGNPLVEDARPTDPKVYWEQLFSKPDPWKYESDYERMKYDRTLAMLDGLRIGRALELGCAEGHFTRMLAGVAETVCATDISTRALGRAAERCAGRSNVEFVQCDFFNEEIPGAWELIVCSEVLYYTNNEVLLARVARKIGAVLAPCGMLLTAHAHLVADDPGKAGFDWDHPFGGKRILEVLATAGELVPVRRLVTPLRKSASVYSGSCVGCCLESPTVRTAACQHGRPRYLPIARPRRGNGSPDTPATIPATCTRTTPSNLNPNQIRSRFASTNSGPSKHLMR
jgi:SAM-dependent methyltransferase